MVRTYLWIPQVDQSILICSICLLEIVHHQVAVSLGGCQYARHQAMEHKPTKGEGRLTETSPCLAITIVNLENIIEIIDCFYEVLAGSQNRADGVHGWNGVWVGAQGLFVGEQGIVDIAKNLRQASYRAVSNRSKSNAMR